jgi:hypothetical protein
MMRNPTHAVKPVVPSAPRYVSAGTRLVSMMRALFAGTIACSRQPRSCNTVAPAGISGTRDATTVPTAAPVSGSPSANGGTYDFASFMRPRMYGSTDISVFFTSSSPSPGGPTSACASEKFASAGSPLGRLASLISRLRTMSLCVVMRARYPRLPLRMPASSR